MPFIVPYSPFSPDCGVLAKVYAPVGTESIEAEWGIMA